MCSSEQGVNLFWRSWTRNSVRLLFIFFGGAVTFLDETVKIIRRRVVIILK